MAMLSWAQPCGYLALTEFKILIWPSIFFCFGALHARSGVSTCQYMLAWRVGLDYSICITFRLFNWPHFFRIKREHFLMRDIERHLRHIPNVLRNTWFNFFYPILEHFAAKFCPLFVQIAQMGLILPRWVSFCPEYHPQPLFFSPHTSL